MTENPRVRFIVPDLPPWEEVAPDLEAVYRSGRLHPGAWVERFEAEACARLKVKHAVMVSTCADGLILLLAYERERRHDVPLIVDVPSFTFRATPQAVDWARGTLVALDVGPDGNVSPAAVERAAACTAFLFVHVFGLPCVTDELMRVLPDHAAVYFDAAHALGAEAPDPVSGELVPVGGFGDAEVFSLNITKAIPSLGEGGLVTTNDERVAGFIRAARWHGDRPGSLDWVVPGMNAKPTELQAVVASHALARMDARLALRAQVARRYDEALAGLAGVERLQHWTDGRVSVWKDYAIRCESRGLRRRIENALASAGVEFKRYFSPVVTEMHAAQCSTAGDAMARELAGTVLCLPIYPSLSGEDQGIVVEAVKHGVAR